MDLRDKIRRVLRENYGEYSTYLEHKYEDILTEKLMTESMKHKREWATYNQVILEIKNSLNDMLRVKELQYRLTDVEDPNEVCIEVIRGIGSMSPELERLYYKINGF